MAKLIYSGILSLDGYLADENGNFDWAEPDEEVHRFVNELERGIGTYLYGRRMYDVMSFWDTDEATVGQPSFIQEFAEIWQAADKVVYSTTLGAAYTDRTRIESRFDPDAVREMKSRLERDLSVGGPNLAVHAIHAGLVDEFHMLVVPVAVGGGLRYLPDTVRIDFQLLDERRFGNGTVFLRYALR
ncbi:MAG TPA: dihydrofolate reductase family protein [Glaciibacter sp.]|nr:dihydrofolate reductase family protein [Glaciibacter sp.]